MEYLFVWNIEGGWYLKIDSTEKLADYYEHILPTRYEGAFELYWLLSKEKEREDSVMGHIMKKPLKERIELMQGKDFNLMYAAIMKAENSKTNMTFLDGIRALNLEMGESDLQYLREYGAVFFNSAGGKTFDIKSKNFCRRKNLVFPQHEEKDIRIKQFEGGAHYYAYIGDIQVRDGDVVKYGTYEEAYNKACEFVTEK